jgi:hypothetical protein
MEKVCCTASFRWLVTCVCIAATMTLASCNNSTNSQSTSSTSPKQVERVEPASGKGNIQGQVLYNNKPVENIEVKLCETFSQFVGGCSGKRYTAKTDREGYYVVTDVDPGKYQALLTRVFETDSFIFATTGIAGISATEYDVTADETLFIDPTHLFKGDLKLLNPAAGSKVNGQNLELSWEAYPDAAYYKFSVYPEDVTVLAPYVDERIDGTSFVIDEPLSKGTYRWTVDAYNSGDRKLAESSDDIKFTVN